MKFEELTGNEIFKCVNEFKTRCYFIYRTYKINRTLFENNSNIYGDLDSPKLVNDALVEHILLQFHKITESASFGKKDKNLSIYFFLEWSWEPEVKSKLEILGQKLKSFVDFKRENNPRHKLLVHWDVKTILFAQKPLGSFQEGDEIAFFQNLNEFIEIMQNALGYQNDWNIFSDEKADEENLLETIKCGSDLIYHLGNSIKYIKTLLTKRSTRTR